jgi:hypothetical protein
MKAQQSIGNAVKSPGPMYFIDGCARPEVLRAPARLCEEPCGAACHFCCRAAGESQEQDPMRIRAMKDEVSDAVGQGIRLAGPGACDDQKRAA